jgi:hypothetical protein
MKPSGSTRLTVSRFTLGLRKKVSMPGGEVTGRLDRKLHQAHRSPEGVPRRIDAVQDHARPAARRPWYGGRSRIPARSAGARSPRRAPAAGRRPGGAPPRSPAVPPARCRTGRSSPAHGGPPGPAWPPAPASSPYARPARRACGRFACVATATAAPAWPAPHSTAAWKSSAGSASAGPPARRSAPGHRVAPPAPATARLPPQPAPGAAMPPARPAPHTTAALPYRAHPGPYAPRTPTVRITRHPGPGPVSTCPGRSGR